MDRKGQGTKKNLVLPLLVGGEPLDPTKSFNFTRDEILGWIQSVVDRTKPKPPDVPPKEGDKDESSQPQVHDGNAMGIVEPSISDGENKPTKPPASGDDDKPPETGNPPSKAPELKPIQVQIIKDMAKWITDLALQGARYRGEEANSGPSHHFSRSLMVGANPKKFNMVDARWISLQFRNLYDILGAFLMVVGQAQSSSTKVNFFLPLTAMYGKWCSVLGGHRDLTPEEEPPVDALERPGRWPTVFQCTWLDHDVATKAPYPFRFCLGALLGGCDFHDEVPGVTGEWRWRLRSARLDMLRNAAAFDEKKYDMSRNPPRQLPDRKIMGNAPWGNCAEAYPFTAIFREVDDWKGLNGLALRRDYFACGDVYNFFNVKKSLVGPCLNCQYMLKKRWGVEYENNLGGKWEKSSNMTY